MHVFCENVITNPCIFVHFCAFIPVHLRTAALAFV